MRYKDMLREGEREILTLREVYTVVKGEFL